MPSPRDERGSIAVWASVSIVAFVIIVGAGVDLSGHAAAEQQARAVAAEAARAGGQYLVVGEGLRPRADVRRAVAAANAYVETSDFTGNTRMEAGEIHVTVSGAYETLFLGVIGVDSLPLRGEGAATVAVVVDGEVR